MVTLLDHARREDDLSLRASDREEARLLLRQVAEKTWGHVCEATNALLHIRATGPDAHRERRERLESLDRAGGTSLKARYEELQHELHGRCFYEGYGPPDIVQGGTRKAEAFLRDIEDALRRTRPR